MQERALFVLTYSHIFGGVSRLGYLDCVCLVGLHMFCVICLWREGCPFIFDLLWKLRAWTSPIFISSWTYLTLGETFPVQYYGVLSLSVPLSAVWKLPFLNKSLSVWREIRIRCCCSCGCLVQWLVDGRKPPVGGGKNKKTSFYWFLFPSSIAQFRELVFS